MNRQPLIYTSFTEDEFLTESPEIHPFRCRRSLSEGAYYRRPLTWVKPFLTKLLRGQNAVYLPGRYGWYLMQSQALYRRPFLHRS